MVIKVGSAVFILVCCVTLFAQASKTAHATYAVNGVLIELSDLAPLRDCPARAIDGKVKTVKENNAVVSFDLESKDKERRTFQFPLSRLASAEQMSFRKDFLHKGLRLRASGYACKGNEDRLETISIVRVY